MNRMNLNGKNILLKGDNKLTFSIAVNFLRAHFIVNLDTDDKKMALSMIETHFSDIKASSGVEYPYDQYLKTSTETSNVSDCYFAVVISSEKSEIKTKSLLEIEKKVAKDCIIAVNTESISLDELQAGLSHPERLIGLNWTEPAHTTRFLEIITNNFVREEIVDEVRQLGGLLEKDPYVVENYGIRSRLLCSMIREAFYLVENGYATIDDIDRACRNDPGYYLPFAGNCRYMDLMGTYAYGMVMKDLNPDLSKADTLPSFYNAIINEGGSGIEKGKGLYRYTYEDQKFWERIGREFSYRIEEIINRYPFNYNESQNK